MAAAEPAHLSADYTKTNWSESTIRNYFALTATPLSTPDQPPPPTVYGALPYPIRPRYSSPQNDTEEIRIGVEYVFIRGRLKIPLRAGYFNNKQIDTFNLEAPPRFNGFTVGTGIILGGSSWTSPISTSTASSRKAARSTDEETAAAQDEVRNTVRNQRFFASLIYRFGRSLRLHQVTSSDDLG